LLAEKAGSLLRDVKWIGLDSGRIQVAMRLLEDIPEQELDEQTILLAMKRAGLVLIDAFASELIPARGIEHFTGGASPILHTPLPLIWWCRIVEFGEEVVESAEFLGDGEKLSAHHLLWEAGQIIRGPSPEKRLAVVTNIEIDVAKLNQFAEIRPSSEGRRELFEKAPRGKRPDKARVEAVRRIAKDVVRKQFGTLSAFKSGVAAIYNETHSEGIGENQVGRDVFGDE
jgi:hypothetical protein